MTVRAGALVAGRYRVEEPIGSGGMGVVWRARDERDGRVVALKRAHGDSDEATLRRTQREARVHGIAAHPRVVAMFDVAPEAGDLWLVMEYVDGRDLGRILAEEGVRPAGGVARIGRQIAEALEAIHGKGFVHGDVSPANVLVTDAGDAKLTDFGAARPIWGDGTLTEGGTAPGTAPYVAPEVARGEEKVPASDIFSLGATLFTAAEGVSPLGEADNPLSHLHRAASGKIASPSVPGALAKVLSALLAAEPGDRPEAAMARRLLAEAEYGTGGVPDPWWRRHLWPVVGGAAVVLVAATVLITLVASGGTGGRGPLPGAATGTPAHATAGAATIGDARTADPCGLINAADFRSFGPTKLDAEYGNFDRCDVEVSTSKGDDLGLVTVYLDEGPPDPPEKGDTSTRNGKIQIWKPAATDKDECDRSLVLPSKQVVYVTAKREGPAGTMNFCRAADIAAAKAAQVLNHGPVPRRVAAPAAKSLARYDTCKLLPDTDIAQIPGLGGARDEPGFGDWSCEWTASHGVPHVQLSFDRGNPLVPGEDGKATQVAGRQAFVRSGDDGPETCSVEVVYRHYTHSDGEPAEELVLVELEGPGSMDERCGQATTLAGAAMARLPRA